MRWCSTPPFETFASMLFHMIPPLLAERRQDWKVPLDPIAFRFINAIISTTTIP
jgi:hypothetical protein